MKTLLTIATIFFLTAFPASNSLAADSTPKQLTALLGQVRAGTLTLEAEQQALNDVRLALAAQTVTLKELGLTVEEFRAMCLECNIKLLAECDKIMRTADRTSQEYKFAELLAKWIREDLKEKK